MAKRPRRSLYTDLGVVGHRPRGVRAPEVPLLQMAFFKPLKTKGPKRAILGSTKAGRRVPSAPAARPFRAVTVHERGLIMIMVISLSHYQEIISESLCIFHINQRLADHKTGPSVIMIMLFFDYHYQAPATFRPFRRLPPPAAPIRGTDPQRVMMVIALPPSRNNL